MRYPVMGSSSFGSFDVTMPIIYFSTCEKPMPYYVFKITQPTQLVKNLDLQDTFDEYKPARALARDLRKNAPAGEQSTYQLVFAANQLEAEENLQERREKPVLMEWEK